MINMLQKTVASVWFVSMKMFYVALEIYAHYELKKFKQKGTCVCLKVVYNI
jgi:hypothetical protein